jgi:glycosyltransferase involved in cell wall biosynthesis
MMKILIVHCLYGGIAPSGEDVTVTKEMTLLGELYGKENVRSLIFSHTKGPFVFFSFFYLLVFANCAYAFNVIAYKPDKIFVHNSFPFVSLLLINFLAGKFSTDLFMHNHRFYCANGLMLRDGNYCDLCLTRKNNLMGFFKKCKNKSFIKSFIYATFGSILRYFRLNNIDRFVTFSNKHKDLVKRSGITDRNNVVVLPHFVSSPPQLAANDLDKGVVGQGGKNEFLFVGRLSEEKGIDQLLSIVSEEPRFNINVIGDGPLKNDLVKRYGGCDRVRFSGKLSQNELLYEMKQSSYLLFNSICFETFGLVIAEAFSQSLPVIARNLGSPSEMVKDGLNGFLFNHENIEEVLLRATELTDSGYTNLCSNARSTFELSFIQLNRRDFYEAGV